MATEFLPTSAITRYYFTQHAGLRTVTDGHTTTSSTTVTSATANFDSTYDVGAGISGAGIPGGATISSVTNSTTVVISAAATATSTTASLTITRTNTLGNSGLQAALIADWGASGTVAQLLPSTFQVLTNSNAPTAALVIVNSNLVLTVNPGQWVGYNYGNWQVLNNTQMTSGASQLFTPATV